MKENKIKSQSNIERLFQSFNSMKNGMILLKNSLIKYKILIQNELDNKSNISFYDIDKCIKELNEKLNAIEMINSNIIDANLMELIIK